MHSISLPISKSIANRILILQAIHRDGLLTVSADMPDDVQLLHHALDILKQAALPHETSETFSTPRLDVGNCGTAMRFLTAYCAQLEGQTTILDGVERMHHRPMGQLVDALREIGAQIEYLGEEGFPPLRIKGCALDKHRIVRIDNPLSTQFISALLLIGANVQTNCNSPYIDITRELIKQWSSREESISPLLGGVGGGFFERDWSSAAFWYEHIALHGGELHLPGLSRDSLQGDKVVADIFAHLGDHTTYTPDGAIISKIANANSSSRPRELIRAEVVDVVVNNSIRSNVVVNSTLHQDFQSCPDLYPAVALTCEKLGVRLEATGTESLSLKESDRLRAVREHRTDHDHRMAMALLVAGYPVDDTDCIRKSYPQFLTQWHTFKNNS